MWGRKSHGSASVGYQSWEHREGRHRGFCPIPIPRLHPTTEGEEPQKSLLFSQKQREVGGALQIPHAAVNISISIVMPLGNYVCLSKTSKKITLCKSGLFLNYWGWVFFFFCSVLQFYIIFLVSKSLPFHMILREGFGGGEMDEQGRKR